jgi:hypothetical protein
MHVIASDAAAERIERDGGSLYVWLKRGRCCGNVTMLESATQPPRSREFHRLDTDAAFTVYASMSRLPDELHVEVRRARVEAYWNGCAWVV